jgi:DNA polymerase III gamma/tau subunit
VSEHVTELYRRYRPQSFKGIVGQPEAVKVMSGWIANGNTPHAVMFVGGSGVGKTSSARILAKKLKCEPPRDLTEINAADFNGIDTVREIRQQASYPSWAGGNRCWIIDEAALLSSQAQNALLKILEEAPPYAYFFLCTTNPEKIIPTVRNRCSEIRLNSVGVKDIMALSQSVLSKEGVEDVGDEVLERLAELAEGSPRKCLVKLQQLVELPDDASRFKMLSKDEAFEATIKDLCEVFTKVQKKTWREVAAIVKSLNETQEPETIRRAVLGWLSSALLGGWARGVNNELLAAIMSNWEMNFFESGKAGVVLAAYRSWSYK